MRSAAVNGECDTFVEGPGRLRISRSIGRRRPSELYLFEEVAGGFRAALRLVRSGVVLWLLLVLAGELIAHA